MERNMKNPLQPTTDLKIGKVTYELLFTLEDVARAEELTDKPLLTGLKQRDISTPKISLVQNMLYACILAKQPNMTFEEVKALITRKNFPEVWSVVLQCWTAGLAEPDEDEGESDPK